MTSGDRIAEILGTWYAHRDDESPLDPEDLIRAHPDLESELRDHFRLMDAVGATLLDDGGSSGPPVPEDLGAFRIVRELGSGGMGTVYLAETTEAVGTVPSGKQIALKVMHPHLFRTPGFYRRFVREGEIGLRVRNPHVVEAHGTGSCEVDGSRLHYVAMEYVEGQTLRELLETPDPVPEGLCRRIGIEACRGLAALHADGAVHRDVKPENIILTHDNVTKVMDFGVAHLTSSDAALSQTGSFVGSVRYAAPEQFSPGEVDGRADLYALGLVLYELATAVHPFSADDVATTLNRQLHDVPRRASELNPKLSPFFEALLQTLLAKDREQRIDSASSTAEALAQGEEGTWWREHASGAAPQHAFRMRTSRPTRIHGRDDEFARLQNLLDRAHAGEGQVVLMEGEAGVGKSRLIDEFLAAACAGSDVQVLLGSYEPFTASTTLQAIRAALLDHYGSRDLERKLGRHVLTATKLIPGLASVLRGESAELGTQRLASALIEVVQGLAREKTTILVIEDLHYASSDARRLFADIARAMAGHGALLLGTHRRGVPKPWLEAVGRLKHFHHLSLARLGPSDLARLLEEAFGSGGMAEELIYQIALKSDGNPLFVFEIIEALKEDGYIRERPDGSWATSEIDHAFQLPSSVSDLISARLDGLSRADRDLLDVAACLGSEFDPAVAAEVLELSTLDSLRRLSALERERHLLRSRGRMFEFDHPQIREVLYERLPLSLKEGYHARIAEYLAAGMPADAAALPVTTCVEITRHLLECGRVDEALPYLDRVAAPASSAQTGALPLSLLDRALEVGDQLPLSRRLRLLLLLGQLQFMEGDLEHCEATFQEALRLADEDHLDDWVPHLLHNLGNLRLQRGDPDGAARHAERLLALAQNSNDATALVQAYTSLGDIEDERGNHQAAMEFFERALAAAEPLGPRSPARCPPLNGIGIALKHLGRYEEARACHGEQLDLAEEANNEHWIMMVRGNLDVLNLMMGHWQDVEIRAREAVARGREWGNRPIVALQQGSLSLALVGQGRLAEALEESEASRRAIAGLGMSVQELHATVAHAQLLLALGQLAEAEREIGLALAAASEKMPPGLRAYAMFGAGCLAAEQGQLKDATALFMSALEVFQGLGDVRFEAIALKNLGAVAQIAQRPREARSYLEDAEKVASSHNLTPQVLGIQAHLVALGWRDGRAVADLLAGEGACMQHEHRLLSHHQLFVGTGDAAHLREAKRLLDYRVEHAPEEYRESMLKNVRLNREIMEAWAEHGGGEQREAPDPA